MMKKILLVVLLTSFSWGFGQNLSLSQLMSLRTMDLDDVEMFLTQRSWSYSDGEAETNEQLGSLEFVYGATGDFDYAQAFIYRLYSKYGEDRISMQISKQEKYLEYINTVKSFKPTLIFTGTFDGDLLKVYQGATTTFIFKTSTAKNRFGDVKSSWHLTIWDNYDFNISQFKSNLLD